MRASRRWFKSAISQDRRMETVQMLEFSSEFYFSLMKRLRRRRRRRPTTMRWLAVRFKIPISRDRRFPAANCNRRLPITIKACNARTAGRPNTAFFLENIWRSVRNVSGCIAGTWNLRNRRSSSSRVDSASFSCPHGIWVPFCRPHMERYIKRYIALQIQKLDKSFITGISM